MLCGGIVLLKLVVIGDEDNTCYHRYRGLNRIMMKRRSRWKRRTYHGRKDAVLAICLFARGVCIRANFRKARGEVAIKRQITRRMKEEASKGREEIKTLL